MTLSIERRAAQWGDRTAVIDVSEEGLYVPAETVDEDRVTYATLARLARDLTAGLDSRGVEAGDVVCICSRNRVATIALLFACRRLGATLAPISHRLTPATVDRPLSTLEPTLVVHERAQRDLVRNVAPSRSAALDDLADDSSVEDDRVDDLSSGEDRGDDLSSGEDRGDDLSSEDDRLGSDETADHHATTGSSVEDDRVDDLSSGEDMVDDLSSDEDRDDHLSSEDDRLGSDETADHHATTGSSIDAETESPAALLALHGAGGTPIVRFGARAVEWNCITAAATWGLGRGDRAFTLRPLATHDGLFRVSLPLLYVGGTIALDRAFDPGDALEAIDREAVTVLAGRAAEFRDLVAREGASAALESIGLAVSDTPVADEVRGAFAEAGVPLRHAYGRLECPNALGDASGETVDPGSDGSVDLGSDGSADSESRGPGSGTPVLDCAARLVDADRVVSGPGTGTLQLSGPVTASGYVGETDGDEGTGRFADGWFDTGDRFRRDENGRYRPA